MDIGTRSDDWHTSVEAWEAILPGLNKIRRQVFGLICAYTTDPNFGGLTDQEIEDIAAQRFGPRATSTYRKRRCELTDAGIVVASILDRPPMTRQHEGARPQIVWRAASVGEIADRLKYAGGDLSKMVANRIAASAKRRREPTVREIIDTWKASECFSPQMAGEAVLELIRRKRQRGARHG